VINKGERRGRRKLIKNSPALPEDHTGDLIIIIRNSVF